MINLILLIAMFGCQKVSALLGADKVITWDYLYSLKYTGLWKNGFEVNVDNLYKLVEEIADHIDVSRLEQEMEVLIREKTAEGCNFFHFLFSLPLRPGDEHFDGFVDIFKKCFPNGKISKEVAQERTEGMDMNILHLAVLSGSTYIGKLILNSTEDASVLDVGDMEGDSPFFITVDKYVNASVGAGDRERKEDYLELLKLMLEKGFSLLHKNRVGDNFLTAVLNGFYDYPYEGKENSRKNKKGMSELVKLLRQFKKLAKKDERVRKELDKVSSSYKRNVTERAERLLKKVDKAIREDKGWSFTRRRNNSYELDIEEQYFLEKRKRAKQEEKERKALEKIYLSYERDAIKRAERLLRQINKVIEE